MPAPTNPLDDHLFGDLEKSPKGTQYLLEHTHGLRHHARKTPLLPQPGDAVRLYATTSSDLPVREVLLRYSTDEWASASTASFTKTDLTWNTLSWSWLQNWQTDLPPQTANTMLRYQVCATLPKKPTGLNIPNTLYADTQSRDPRQATNYAIWYGGGATPAWAKTARIYQVFVDRFNPGQG
ncbi:MAG: hypothetical protein WA110_10900, partial [Anaerolineaceae bacterium]